MKLIRATVMPTLKNYWLLSLLFGLLACASTQDTPESQTKITDKKTAAKPVAKPIKTADLIGLYLANLPCPNCGSVRVNLVLEADNRYDKSEEVTHGQDIYFETGQWVQKNGHIHLLPDDISADTVSTIRHFRYDGKTLILLDENGKDYTGNSARYRFQKK